MVFARVGLGGDDRVFPLAYDATKGRRIKLLQYVSTRGQAPDLGFEQAMLAGLARDGGLYVPAQVPQLSQGDIAAFAGLPYEEVAFRVMRPFVDLPDDVFRGLIDKAYAGFGHAARAPMVQLDSGHFLLELFHGPTLAFKDFAMQLIGQLFQEAMARKGDRITIVGATSGDTGSAAIEAFRGLDAVDVFILFPHGRVSDVQRRQMTTPSETNVHALALDGDFDDCQAAVKAMFNDFDFRDGVGLTAINSINWARVLAQVVYFSPRRLPWARLTGQSALRCRRVILAIFLQGTLPKRWGFPLIVWLWRPTATIFCTVRWQPAPI